MKLSEMKSQMSGLPEGFTGVKTAWTDVRESFAIVKACMFVRPQVLDNGEIAQNPETGAIYYDRNVAMSVKTESGKDLLVYTNSPKIVSLFRTQIAEDRQPDTVNRYGADVYLLDVPEGKVKFVAAKYKYGKMGEKDVADLQEAD